MLMRAPTSNIHAKTTRSVGKTRPAASSVLACREAAERKADESDPVLQKMLQGVEAATRGRVGVHLGPMTRLERRKLLLGEGE